MSLPLLRHNIMALALVQMGNYAVPLLTLPYLTRTLGVESYGQVAFVQVVMAFAVLFVDFGFSLSTTRHISTCRDDPVQVSKTFFTTWLAQWLLLVLAALVLVVVVVGVPGLRMQASLYFWGFGLVLGHVLFPIWLFQGLEDLKAVAWVQLGSKLLSLPLLFVLVRTSEDAAWALGFFSVVSLLTGVFALGWIVRSNLLVWYRPSLDDVSMVYREAAVLFFSKISISLYTALVPLVLGAVCGPTQLAFFNIADKVKTVVQSMIGPVSQALFPRMSLLYQTNVPEANALARKTAWGVTILSGTVGGLVWFGADRILGVLAGGAFVEGALVLRWLAFVPCVVALSNLLGLQVMLPRGQNRAFALILSGASLLSLLVVYPLIKKNQAVGAAQLVLLVESMVTLAMAVYVWRVPLNGAASSGAAIKQNGKN